MRSVDLVAPRTLEVRERPAPEPGPGEVLIRLRAVGLCGSDMHWYLEGGIGAHRAVYPMVLGHEPAGEIVAVGTGVAGRAPGQLVSVEPTITCGHCEFCLAGRHNNCPNGVFLGGPQAPGFFREYAAVPARNTELVPAGMTIQQAALIEPVAVIVHVLDLIEICPGDTVAVLGAGSIGLLCVAMAKLAGASRVVAADKLAHRLALARTMGADVVVHTPAESAVDAVLDSTGGRGADVVLDAAGSPETINAAIAACRPTGPVVLIGIPSASLVTLDLVAAMGKELRIVTVKRSNHRGAAAIELLRGGRIPETLITHTLPLEKTPEAFEMLAHYRDGVGKVLIGIS